MFNDVYFSSWYCPSMMIVKIEMVDVSDTITSRTKVMRDLMDNPIAMLETTSSSDTIGKVRGEKTIALACKL